MKIAFVTTQTLSGSTVRGRILHLATNFANIHHVYVLHHGPSTTKISNITLQPVGKDPFIKNNSGKQRLSGMSLIMRMLRNSLQSAVTLTSLKPDTIIVSKALPESVLAASIARLFRPSVRIILDVDDFELTANKLSSALQRASIHWAERTGAKIANTIVVATPFLEDHFKQLTQNKKRVALIPTGANQINIDMTDPPKRLLYLGSISKSSGHATNLLPEILQEIQKENPNIGLIIAGVGDDIVFLKNRFKELKLEHSVTWYGEFSHDDLLDLLQKSVLLDPIDASITTRAKSSYRATLAAVNGIPVVTSNIGIRAQLIPQNLHDRFFAEPNNAKSFAQKANNLITAPLSQQEILELKNHGKQFIWDNLSSTYGQLF